MPALTNVEFTAAATEEPFADAFQVRGNLTIRHGDPEYPQEVNVSADDPSSLVELAVVVADALSQSLATRDLTDAARARLQYAARVLSTW